MSFVFPMLIRIFFFSFFLFALLLNYILSFFDQSLLSSAFFCRYSSNISVLPFFVLLFPFIFMIVESLLSFCLLFVFTFSFNSYPLFLSIVGLLFPHLTVSNVFISFFLLRLFNFFYFLFFIDVSYCYFFFFFFFGVSSSFETIIPFAYSSKKINNNGTYAFFESSIII